MDELRAEATRAELDLQSAKEARLQHKQAVGRNLLRRLGNYLSGKGKRLKRNLERAERSRNYVVDELARTKDEAKAASEAVADGRDRYERYTIAYSAFEAFNTGEAAAP